MGETENPNCKRIGIKFNSIMDSQHNDAALKSAPGFKGHINRSGMLGVEVKSLSCHVLLGPTWTSVPAQGTLEGLEYQIY